MQTRWWRAQRALAAVSRRALADAARPRVPHADAAHAHEYLADAPTRVAAAARPPIFEDVEPQLPPPRAPIARAATPPHLPPLDAPLPNVHIPLEEPKAPLKNGVKSEQTALRSGLRVRSARVRRGAPAAVVGVALRGGARHERADERGAALLLERAAFKARTLAPRVEALRARGGALQPFYTRELSVLLAEVLPGDARDALELCADALWRVADDSAAFADAQRDAALALDEYRNAPARFVPEMLHAIAFGAAHGDADGGLGRPLLCSARELERLTPDAVRAFVERRAHAGALMVGGAGAVEHAELVDAAQQLFADVPAGEPPGDTPAAGDGAPSSPYRGGVHKLEAEGGEPTTHVALGFEGVPVASDDVYASFVLQQLLGGGDSFSTGGPGKGMHSQLYRQVLSRYGAFETCVAFNHSYAETGLFGIFASVSQATAGDVVALLVDQLTRVAKGVDDVQFRRAQNSLKGSVLMNLESRLVLFEDLINQCAHNADMPPELVCERIDALTKEDLAAFVRRQLRSRPSLLAFGPPAALQNVPACEELQFTIEQQLG